MPPTPESRPVQAVSEPLTGTVAGRFEIRSLLGVGGMGEIYLADDTRLKRPVALKRLAPKLRHNQKYRQHLLKEAERASSLNFQYIAAIHDVVEANDELLLVMEYVEGKTLRRHLPATWDVHDFLELAIQCAEALVAAHEKGVVHRDIKPENIMITPAGQVKVLDYGLAKQLPVVDENAITKTSTSASHELSGTWGYMAPEVLLEKNVDGRADIFSLGVVFYEMLSGRSPFLAPSFVQTLDRTLHDDPKPLGSVVGGIPAELERIVAKMLAKSADERYATARDLAVDLRALQRAIYSGGVLPAPARVRRSTRGRFRDVLIALLSVAVLVALAVIAFRFARRPAAPTTGSSPLPSQKLVAVLPFRTIGGRPEDQVYGDGLSETLSAKLTQLTASHDLQVAPAGEVFAHRVHDVDTARRELGVNLVLEGSLHQVGNSVRVTYALVDASTQRQLRADTVTADASDPFELEDRVVASVLHTLDLGVNPQEQQALSSYGTKIGGAHDLYLQGRGYLQAYYDPSKVDSAVDMFHRALELDPRYALAYAGLGEAFWRKYESTKDAQWVENAREACDKAAALEANLGAAHTCLGTLDNGTGQYDQAVAEFQRAATADPTNDDAFRGLAVAYEKLNKPVEAERTYKLAIELRPHYWAGYDWLAVFYIQQGRYTDAAQQFQRAAELAPNNGNVYYSLGGTDLYLGRYEDAIAALRHGIEIRPSSPAYSNLGMAYFRLRRFPEAVQALETAYQLGPHDPSVAGNLANAYYWAPGYRDKAPAAFRNAISLAHDELKVNPKDTGAHILLADFYALLGEEKPAYDHLKRALALDPNDGEAWVYAAIVDQQFGRRDEAISDVEHAVKFGYSTAELAHAVELDRLRDDPRFQQLIAPNK